MAVHTVTCTGGRVDGCVGGFTATRVSVCTETRVYGNLYVCESVRVRMCPQLDPAGCPRAPAPSAPVKGSGKLWSIGNPMMINGHQIGAVTGLSVVVLC